MVLVDSRVGRLIAVSMVVVGIPLAGGRIKPNTPGESNLALLEAPDPEVVKGNADWGVALDRAAHGRSGTLLTRQALPGESIAIPLDWSGSRPGDAWYRWNKEFAGKEKSAPAAEIPLDREGKFLAPSEPGIYHLEIGAADRSHSLEELKLIVKVPFKRKEGTHLQGYFIGRFPTEGQKRNDRYATPVGFIEVTRENQDLRLSKHFKIKEFLTKDQHNVWPKYVIIDPLLIEKLELVMQELNEMGVRAERMHIMSGFRTPQYNARGLKQGRANLSRHQYGDGADVWIDNDGDGYMDDLNGDGKRDTNDARVILRAVDRVTAKHPELTGGAGIYRANSAHGPFIHIDVRGSRARW